MKLVVGLGNIGKEYENTYHNAGFITIDAVASELGVKFNNRSCDADWGDTNYKGEKVILAKPRTYMNLSGKSVNSFMKKYNINISDVLVIVDDIDQEVGGIRIRKTGSAGTHNGLKSIIAETGGKDFLRVRVGIGKQREHQDLKDFVLSKIKMTDEQKSGFERAKLAVIDILSGESVDSVMTKYNGNIDKNGK